MQGKSSRRRRFTSALHLPVAALVLAGCAAITPVDLEVSVPDTYRQTADKRPALPVKSDWWRNFRSVELSTLIEEARLRNLDIAVATANIEQAQAEIGLANAALFPTLDVQTSAQRTRAASFAGRIGKGRNLFGMSASASYELDFWNRNSAALAAAISAGKASEYERDTVELMTIASMANAYFALLAAQDRLRLARENVAAASHILDLVKSRFSAGMANGLDVAQQESLVAQQKAAIPPLELSIQHSKAAIALLVARPPALVDVKGGSARQVRIPPVSAGIPSQLLTRRPDIAQARANLIASHQQARSAYAEQFPSITLTGQAGVQSSALKSLFDPAAGSYSIAAGIFQPLFDAGARQSSVERANSIQDASLATYRKTVVQAFVDVENALASLRLITRQEALQQAVITSARRAYTISEQQLRGGTVDFITVLQTQQNLFTAQDALVQTRLSRLQAVIALHQALGGGWTAPATP